MKGLILFYAYHTSTYLIEKKYDIKRGIRVKQGGVEHLGKIKDKNLINQFQLFYSNLI